MTRTLSGTETATYGGLPATHDPSSGAVQVRHTTTWSDRMALSVFTATFLGFPLGYQGSRLLHLFFESIPQQGLIIASMGAGAALASLLTWRLARHRHVRLNVPRLVRLTGRTEDGRTLVCRAWVCARTHKEAFAEAKRGQPDWKEPDGSPADAGRIVCVETEIEDVVLPFDAPDPEPAAAPQHSTTSSVDAVVAALEAAATHAHRAGAVAAIESAAARLARLAQAPRTGAPGTNAQAALADLLPILVRKAQDCRSGTGGLAAVEDLTRALDILSDRLRPLEREHRAEQVRALDEATRSLRELPLFAPAEKTAATPFGRADA